MKKYYLLLVGLIFCLFVTAQPSQFSVICYFLLQNIIYG